MTQRAKIGNAGLESLTNWVHDMVCTAKGVGVIVRVAVRGYLGSSDATWGEMRKWARMPQKFGGNTTLVWVRWLGNSRKELYPDGLPPGTKFSELEARRWCMRASEWPGN